MKAWGLSAGGLACLLTLTACASGGPDPLEDYEQVIPSTLLAAPGPVPGSEPSEAVERGRYLVALLGCGSCHSNGALVGRPVEGQLLAGSDVGIAYSNPLVERYPGVVFPANLTPDPETGIGQWTVAQLATMIRSGIDNHSTQTLPVMPWPAYAGITPDDAEAIGAYLLSLPPVRHQVPGNVRPGQRSAAPFVHFGVYRSREDL